MQLTIKAKDVKPGDVLCSSYGNFRRGDRVSTVLPSFAIGKTVSTIRGSIRVSGCIENGDGTSVLYGYTLGDRRDWIGVSSAEPLEVISNEG